MTHVVDAQADVPKRGHLVIIGGGLRPDNTQVFQSLIQFAGGAEKARFVILPTAATHKKIPICLLKSYRCTASRRIEPKC